MWRCRHTFVFPALLLILAMTGCGTDPSGQKPRPTAAPPNVRPDYGKALDVMSDGFGYTLKPGDCEPGTGPGALENKPDTPRRPPCKATMQYRQRLEQLKQKGRTP